ncbi:MAG: hypothetical protein JW934_09405 [Anaerolineae bacterium]|nr:hypothetical protein [Anaerolineae bacterium]
MDDIAHRKARIYYIAGDVLLLCYLLIVSAGQLVLFAHMASPWREWLLLASVVVEYTGLSRFSAWINRVIDARVNGEEGRRREPPIVLISSGTPSEEAVDEVLQLAAQAHKRILLVSLIGPQNGGTSDWIASVQPRLAAAGLHVSAQEVYTRDLAATAGEITLAAESSNVIWAEH